MCRWKDHGCQRDIVGGHLHCNIDFCVEREVFIVVVDIRLIEMNNQTELVIFKVLAHLWAMTLLQSCTVRHPQAVPGDVAPPGDVTPAVTGGVALPA